MSKPLSYIFARHYTRALFFFLEAVDINNGMYVQATQITLGLIESFVLQGRHLTSLQLTTMMATLVHAASQSYCNPWNMHTNSLSASLVTINRFYFNMSLCATSTCTSCSNYMRALFILIPNMHLYQHPADNCLIDPLTSAATAPLALKFISSFHTTVPSRPGVAAQTIGR